MSHDPFDEATEASSAWATPTTPSGEGGGRVPVKFTIDLDQMFRSYYDEEQINPVVDMAVNVMAQRLIDEVGAEVKKAVIATVQETIQEQVGHIVGEALRGDIQRTSAYGGAQGPPVPLTQAIVDEAASWAKSTDSYGSRQTKMQELIRKEVDAAIKADLKATMDEHRSAIKDRMAAMVATLMAEEATRR